MGCSDRRVVYACMHWRRPRKKAKSQPRAAPSTETRCDCVSRQPALALSITHFLDPGPHAMKQFFQRPNRVPCFFRDVSYCFWDLDVQGMFQSATMRLPPIACNISAVLFKSNLLRLFQWTAKCVRDREYLVDAVSSVELCLLWEVAREHLVHSERALISLRAVGFRYRSVDLKMIHLSRRAGFCPTAQIV